MPTPPCCVRRDTAVTRARYDLAIVARRMARRPSEKLKAEIALAKKAVKESEAARTDHEAEHAGE